MDNFEPSTRSEWEYSNRKIHIIFIIIGSSLCSEILMLCLSYLKSTHQRFDKDLLHALLY